MINVIGLGYIGLPTALMLAAHGAEVVGTDYDAALVGQLQAGQVTFEEEGLEALFAQAITGGIRFATAYQATNQYIVAVPTPYDKASKKINAAYVEAAVREILTVCENGAMIIIESTVSPGTIDRAIRPILGANGFTAGVDIHLVHAPERIIPGSMIRELRENARTIGADDPAAAAQAKALYATFCQGDIVLTDIRTAEMTKVVENTYRDINIAYANELAKICRSDNLNVYDIIRIANMHPRVNILSPGPGVGGHCISVDPWFLVGDYPGLANIILAARKINDSMPEYVLERIHTIMQEKGLRDVGRVGLYGLTYKENVDDVRESPTLQLLDCMHRHLAGGIQVYDPMVHQDLIENQHHDFDAFLQAIDMVVIMVGHEELHRNLGKLQGKIVLDTRHICGDAAAYLL